MRRQCSRMLHSDNEMFLRCSILSFYEIPQSTKMHSQKNNPKVTTHPLLPPYIIILYPRTEKTSQILARQEM